MIKRITENFTVGILIVMGLASALISLLDLVISDFETFSIFKETPQVTLFLVGLLCMAVGLERFTKFESLEQKLEGLVRRLEKTVTAQSLEGVDQIYSSAMELLDSAENVVRVAAYGELPSAQLERYTTALIFKLDQSKKRRRPIEYRVVIGDITPTVDSDRINKLKQRFEVYKSRGLSQQILYRYINIPIGLNLFIVDEKHLIISFPTLSTSIPRKAVKFVDKPELVMSVCSWFDQYPWLQAKDISSL